MKLFTVSVLALAVAASASSGATMRVDFETVGNGLTGVENGGAFGLQRNDHVQGFFTYDSEKVQYGKNSLSDAMLSFSMTTGTKEWTINDIVAGHALDSISFYPRRGLYGFELFVGVEGGDRALVASRGTVSVSEGGNTSNWCNSCVNYTLAEATTPVPLPAGLPLIASSLLAFGALRMRRKA